MQIVGWVFVVLFCNEVKGKVQTLFGAEAQQKDFVLDLKPMLEMKDVSLVQCLILCKTHACQSFNYGQGLCTILDTYYCASKTAMESMKSKPGFGYYDVAGNAEKNVTGSIEKLFSGSCTGKQNCSARCRKKEGSAAETSAAPAPEPTTPGLECVTDGVRGTAPAGTPCVFPFTYNDRVYNVCTNVGNENASDTWCSTDSNPDRSSWGTCAPQCPMKFECVTDGVSGQGSPSGTPCVFPFVFKEVEYNGCTSLYNGYESSGSWCSTLTTGKDWYEYNWGSCSSSCPQALGCATDGELGPSPSGTNCNFPFVYDGIEYVQCTDVGNNTAGANKTWCSTNPKNKTYDSKMWGSCGPKCVVKECLTSKNTKCFFPLTYKDQVWRACTNRDYTQIEEYLWCSPDEEFSTWTWQYCQPQCPRIWSNLTSS